MFYTIEEFITLVRITRATFYNWLAAGTAPVTVKIGRHRLIPQEAAELWLAAQLGETVIGAMERQGAGR